MDFDKIPNRIVEISFLLNNGRRNDVISNYILLSTWVNSKNKIL